MKRWKSSGSIYFVFAQYRYSSNRSRYMNNQLVLVQPIRMAGVQKAAKRDIRMGVGTGTTGWVPETELGIFLLRKISRSYPFNVCIQFFNSYLC